MHLKIREQIRGLQGAWLSIPEDLEHAGTAEEAGPERPLPPDFFRTAAFGDGALDDGRFARTQNFERNTG
jgi:hypothetical protein